MFIKKYLKDEDNFNYSHGNCFKTKEEAQKYFCYLEALGRVRLYCEENWWFEPDWDNNNRENYFLYYNHAGRTICRTMRGFNELQSILPFLPSEEACDDVIKNNEADLQIIFNAK